MCVAGAVVLAVASWNSITDGLAVFVTGPIIAFGSALLVAPMPSLTRTSKLVAWIVLLFVGYSHPAWCLGLYAVFEGLSRRGDIPTPLVIATAVPYAVLCAVLVERRIMWIVFLGAALAGVVANLVLPHAWGICSALLVLAASTSLLWGCLQERHRDPAWFLARSLCPRCLYNLTGNTSGVCPECGTPISAS